MAKANNTLLNLYEDLVKYYSLFTFSNHLPICRLQAEAKVPFLAVFVVTTIDLLSITQLEPSHLACIV